MSEVKMPEPTITSYQVDSTMRRMEIKSYDEQDMEAYAAAKVREAIEQAADIANEWAMKYVEVDTAHVKVGFYILDEIKGTEI